MSIINRMVGIATREVEFERNSHIDEKVDARLAGHLAEIPGATASKEAYIKEGLSFLDYFSTLAADEIAEIREVISALSDEETGKLRELEEIIAGIQDLEADAKQVDRDEFAAAIGKDWDEGMENGRFGGHE